MNVSTGVLNDLVADLSPVVNEITDLVDDDTPDTLAVSLTIRVSEAKKIVLHYNRLLSAMKQSN